MKRSHVIVIVIAAALAWLTWRNGNIDSRTLIFLAVLLPSIIIHEISHGWVALAFGDPTARDAGRLTLNPVAHVDPFGTLILPAMLLFAGGPAFGWAKPVPVSPSRMRNPRNHSLLVALAGPATNLVLMAIATAAFRLLQPDSGSLAAEILLTAGLANVILAVFNLLPIPPLDGSAILERVLPASLWPGYLRLRQYSFLLLFALFFLVPGFFGRIIGPAIDAWSRLVFA